MRALIVGAGPSGLGAAKVFQKAGLEFDCVDRAERIGGMRASGDRGARVPVARDQRLAAESRLQRLPAARVLGQQTMIYAIWVMAELQARFVADLLRGAYALPDEPGIARATSLVRSAPPQNCSFYAHDLMREMRRGRRRALQRPLRS